MQNKKSKIISIIVIIGIILVSFSSTSAVNLNNNSKKIPCQIYVIDRIESYKIQNSISKRDELDVFIDTFKQELDNSETLNETIAIFNDAIVTLYEIGLIPNDVSVIDLQNEITGNDQLCYKNPYGEKYRNHNCLIAGESTWTYRGRLIPFDNWFSIVHGAFDNLCGGIFYPAAGWIYTKGANGEWSYDGKFYGTLDVIITPGFNEHYVGATGFIGIIPGSFYIGFAARVGIETV